MEHESGMEEFQVGSNIDEMLNAAEPLKEEQAQPENKGAEPTGEAEVQATEQESSPDPGLIKIGDVEWTEQDWLAAREDRLNKEKWVDKNTKLGQLYKSKYVTPQNVEWVLPYAIGNKPLPDSLENSLKTMLPEKVEVELRDEDGEPVKGEVELKKLLPKDFMESVKKQMINEYFPQFAEYQEAAQNYEKLKSDYDLHMEISASENLQLFVKDKPFLNLTVPKGKTMQEQLHATLMAGEDHPEFNNALKLFELLKLREDTGQSIEAVYNAKYADQIQKEKQAEAIKKNQQAPMPEKPGERTIEKTDDEKFMMGVQDDHKMAVSEFFRRE